MTRRKATPVSDCVCHWCGQTAQFDFKTALGPWAYGCAKCRRKHRAGQDHASRIKPVQPAQLGAEQAHAVATSAQTLGDQARAAGMTGVLTCRACDTRYELGPGKPVRTRCGECGQVLEGQVLDRSVEAGG